MKTVAVIPARLESRRLPGKVLREICGKSLIRRVHDRVSAARSVDRVLIATDSAEVESACRGFTSDIFLSRKEHPSGTDRAAEVVQTIEADLVVNVQCDEPMMDPALIDGLVELFGDPEVQMASAARRLDRVEELLDPNAVKVVTDSRGDALYFSRAPIPWPRDDPPRGEGPLPENTPARKHIGIYAYRRACLLALAALPRTPLEIAESLEQLRALENGRKIRILDWAYAGIDVDTEEGLERVRAALAREEGSA